MYVIVLFVVVVVVVSGGYSKNVRVHAGAEKGTYFSLDRPFDLFICLCKIMLA